MPEPQGGGDKFAGRGAEMRRLQRRAGRPVARRCIEEPRTPEFSAVHPHRCHPGACHRDPSRREFEQSNYAEDLERIPRHSLPRSVTH